MKEIYLAGGPFYGIQEVFSRLRGVTDTVAGYAAIGVEGVQAGELPGEADEVECVKVIYDPKKIDISMLLDVFFTVVNPYTMGVQGKCAGMQYRTGIYYTSREDIPQITYYMAFIQNRGVARPISESCLVMNEFDGRTFRRPPVRTKTGPLGGFRPAPEEQQHYLRKHPETYSPIDIHLLEDLKILQ